MILIMSGAYIAPEMQADLGELPPAFLPLGNRRAFDLQTAEIRRAFPEETIFLSLPASFEIPHFDRLRLHTLGITPLPIPDRFSLGQSLLHSINTTGRYDEPLRILHGDTLVKNIPTALDLIATATSEEYYPWEVESSVDGAQQVWCGYFAFSHVPQLVRNLSLTQGDFVSAIRSYQQTLPIAFVPTTEWHDFGHVNTYYQTRARVSTQRVFNEMTIAAGIVHKKSQQQTKIAAEFFWLNNLPESLSTYTPKIIAPRAGQVHDAGYKTEYQPYLPLSELFVHCQLPRQSWKKILRLINRLLQDFQEASVQAQDFNPAQSAKSYAYLVQNKTNHRLEQFVEQTHFPVDTPIQLNGRCLPSVKHMIADCQADSLLIPPVYAISHGDLCFSNILFDSRMSSLKIIDPRGLDGFEQPSLFGNLVYDYAKLTHSMIGLYDHILSNRYLLEIREPAHFQFSIPIEATTQAIQTSFLRDFTLNGIPPLQVLPLTALLFFSMLPLHPEDKHRQMALLANGCRLYELWQMERR